MAVEVVTFGCRLNTYESEAMQRHAEEAGLGEVVIVNTCAVTGEATRQARQSIRKLARLEPSLVAFGHGAPLRDTRKFVDFCATVPG